MMTQIMSGKPTPSSSDLWHVTRPSLYYPLQLFFTSLMFDLPHSKSSIITNSMKLRFIDIMQTDPNLIPKVIDLNY